MRYIVGSSVWCRSTNSLSHAKLPWIDLMLNYWANKGLVVQHQIDSNGYIVGSSTLEWTTNNLYACLWSIRKNFWHQIEQPKINLVLTYSHAELPTFYLILNNQAKKLLVVRHKMDSNWYIVGSSTWKLTTNN
jgi:hypothetical protein